MENVGIFCDHLESFTAISYILWPFGIVSGPLVFFPPFWYIWTKKNLAALLPSIHPVFPRYEAICTRRQKSTEERV
jgi:hypothetical protein